jgi:hypothetical protein
LVEDAQALGELLRTSSSDVIVVINEALTSKNPQTKKTADAIKEAGDNALVVVTTSIEQAKQSLEKTAPGVKKAILKNGREAIIVLDKSLKNPLVISGVSKFAKAQGIPASEAVLTIAGLALSRLLRAIPMEDEGEEVEEGEVRIRELDASDLHRTTTEEENREAATLSTAAGTKADQAAKDGSKCCVS